MNSPANPTDSRSLEGSGASLSVRLQEVSLTFSGVQAGGKRTIKALDNVSLDIHKGECLALVGGSGSGKSTLAQVICGLLKPDRGRVEVPDNAPHRRWFRKHNRVNRVQMVFQDPYSSLDPMWSVARSIEEALLLRFGDRRDDNGHGVDHYLQSVGLDESVKRRKPKQLSGGQVQRIAIARALAARPSVLLMDEAVSSLDVSVQAQILHLVERIKREQHLTIVFIVHNLAVAAAIADRVAVMQRGVLVELGETRRIFAAPRHAYTRQLIASIPDVAGSRTGRQPEQAPLQEAPRLAPGRRSANGDGSGQPV